MKQQVLIVHGGTTYPSYVSYIDSLESIQMDISKLTYRVDWKDTITADLGNKYEVFLPKMPDSTNARYNEWKIWFEKIIPLLKDNLILVGHSLGGIFLAKYLSENIIKNKVKTVILVAAPFEDLELEKLSDFNLPKSLSKLKEQIEDITLFQSEDDPVVPAEHVGLYKAQLPAATIILLKNNGHFKQDHFPELVELIKSLQT